MSPDADRADLISRLPAVGHLRSKHQQLARDLWALDFESSIELEARAFQSLNQQIPIVLYFRVLELPPACLALVMSTFWHFRCVAIIELDFRLVVLIA